MLEKRIANKKVSRWRENINFKRKSTKTMSIRSMDDSHLHKTTEIGVIKRDKLTKAANLYMYINK